MTADEIPCGRPAKKLCYGELECWCKHGEPRMTPTPTYEGESMEEKESNSDEKRAFRAAVKRANIMRKSDGETIVTCPASRHAQMIAEAVGARKPYPMLQEEPEHCAGSILSTVGSLFEARLMIAKGVHFTEHEVDALLRAADYMSADEASITTLEADRIAAVLRSLAITHGSSPAAAGVGACDKPLPPEVLIDAQQDRAHTPEALKPCTRGVRACVPPVDADGDPVTPQRLIEWLDVKFARHGEEEDKWAADYIRATLGVLDTVKEQGNG